MSGIFPSSNLDAINSSFKPGSASPRLVDPSDAVFVPKPLGAAPIVVVEAEFWAPNPALLFRPNALVVEVWPNAEVVFD